MKIMATKMPTGVKATLMPSAAERRAQPALFSANSAVKATPATARRQREGNIDDGVEQPPAGKR